MRRNRIGGISVKHNQQYIDENSNYDDLWERFVTITDIHNGYEFAFDEVNETIYWTQIKTFLPDGTPTVRNSFFLPHKKKLTLVFSMKFVGLISMVQMKLFSMVMMRFSLVWKQVQCKSMLLAGMIFFRNKFLFNNIYDLVICLLQTFVIVELMPYL
jgi:hypothetical protein